MSESKKPDFKGPVPMIGGPRVVRSSRQGCGCFTAEMEDGSVHEEPCDAHCFVFAGDMIRRVGERMLARHAEAQAKAAAEQAGKNGEVGP